MTQTSGASSSAERPLFRYDLQTTAIEESGNRFVDVVGPNGGKSFRFYEVEYAVACGMDGQRDLAGIVRWAMLELDLQTTTAEVGAIVAKLAELDYIETDGVVPEAIDDEIIEAPVAAVTAKADPPTPKVADTVPAKARGMDLELGDSGKSPIGGPRPARPSEAPDLELGLPGRGTATARASASTQQSIDSEFELGVAGNEGTAPVDELELELATPVAVAAGDEITAPSKSVSTDLSQTFRVDTDEVKEAVRASKIMPAVDPEALEAELAAAAEQATPVAIDKKSDISSQIAEDAKDEDSAEAIALKDSEENEAKRSAAVARQEAAAKKKAAHKPLVRRSASILLWLLLLSAVAGGAYYYYTEYVLEPEQQAVLPPRAPAPEPVPEPVPAPTSEMTLTDAPAEEALAGQAGVVAWVVDPGSEVSEGDAILKLRGFERLEKDVDKEKKSLETYQLRLETAQARNTADKIPELEANVARKEADLASANKKLDAFLVKAPIDGVVEVLVAAKAKIKANQAIAKVTGIAGAVAVFTLPEGRVGTLDAELEVVALDDAELKATCTIIETEGQEVTISCPADSGIAAGAAIQLVQE